MGELPADLIPLPTQPWDERPETLPLDREECRTALWRCRGNITEAAKLLKVNPTRFRRFVRNSPYLSSECEEAREQLVDIAEDVVYEALTDDEDAGRRDQMARFVLNSQGRTRGYGNGQGAASVNINNKGGVIQIAWADGTSIGPQPEEEKVIEGEVANDV